MILVFFLMWPWITAARVLVENGERRRRWCLCFLSSNIYFHGSFRTRLVFHQTWPLKSVIDLCLFAGIQPICFCCFCPCKSCVTVFIDLTAYHALHRKGKETWFDFFFLLFCFSFSLLPSIFSTILWFPLNLFLPLLYHWTRDEAEMEYLKIAQDLDMYGVNYFLIRVSRCCIDYFVMLRCS